MFKPRWYKVLRDLWGNKTRTLLVVLSIAVGVSAIGVIANSQVILSRDLTNSYLAMNPASAKLTTEPFDDNLVQVVRNMKEVREAEGRRIIVGRVKVSVDEWHNIELFAIPNYENIRVNTIATENGVSPPSERELLIERSSLNFIGVNEGDVLQFETSSGKLRQLRITGLVHDIHQIPSNLRRRAYGYITLDTLEWFGEPRQFNELHFIVAENTFDEQHIQHVTELVKNKVQKSGRTVFRTKIPDPGKHELDQYIQTMLLILGVLGIFALLMSAALVFNTISALLAQQIRQIGVIKTIGARTHQIMGMYLSMVLIFGLLALVVAVPLGLLGTVVLTSYIARLFNFDLVHVSFPRQVLALQIVIGLIGPLLAALYPIIIASRITVREAISNYEANKGQFGKSLVDSLLERLRGLSRPLLLSLRNTFRRKERLALTLFTLTLGGACFIAVFSVRASLLLTLDDLGEYWKYDVEVNFNRSYRIEQVEKEALSVPGVVGVESWGFKYGFRLQPDGRESKAEITIIAPPNATNLVQPTLLQGRWLLEEDENAIVINSDLLRDEPDIKVGHEIVLKIDGRETTWRVVGLITGQLQGPIAYANPSYLARTFREVERTRFLAIETERHNEAFQSQVAKALELHFKNKGLDVTQIETNSEIRSAVEFLFNIIIGFLSIMALLFAVVGGLGLMGTMSLNVLERTREIGVMRAIGASDGAVRQIFLVEGIFIGILSWLLATILALPLSKFLSDQVGVSFLYAPLNYTFSENGILFWLVVVFILAALATLLPAWNASRLSVRSVLEYE